MKITEFSSTSRTSSAGKKNASSSVSAGDSFLGLLSTTDVEAPPAASTASDISAVTSLDTLISLQEMPEEEQRKRHAVRESQTTLEALDHLRLALLSDKVSAQTLEQLGHRVALQKQHISDPQLKSLMDDIELRAAVELAKLERASQNS